MKKLTIIIADDDYLVLNDLCSMIDWDSLGFTVAATTTSGEETLKAIDRYHPFLLITDICMIGMTGLDVIEKAHQKYPNMKFLVISSYDNFYYAKRAMANGVLDYLLKTEITPAALTQKLIEAKNSFSQDNSISTSMVAHHLEQYFSSEQYSLDDYPLLIQLKNCHYYFIVLAIAHLFTKNTDYTLESYRNQMNSMLTGVHQLALEYCALPLTFCFEDFIIVGLSSDMMTMFSLRDYLNKLVYRYNASSMPLVQFYLQKPDSLMDFHLFIHSVLPFLRYDIFFYSKHAINMSSFKTRRYIQITEPFSFYSLTFDEDHFESDILLIKNYVENCCNSFDLDALIHFFQNFCSYIEISTNNQIKLAPTLHAPTQEYFQKWIYDTLFDCMQLLSRGLKFTYSPVVDSAITFMNQNYSDYELSLSDIASHVGLSINRLGVLFKKDTGKTINEYLNKIRIDKAINFLEKTDMKIYEISDKCGYKSSQYFSQVFYQKTGKKPIEYRKANK